MAGTVLDLEGAIPEAQALAVAKRPGYVHPRAPRAKAPRDAAQRDHEVLGDPVPEHELGGEAILLLGVGGEVRDEPDDGLDRRNLGAGALGHDLDKPQVVDVLMAHDHELEVGNRVPEPGELALQLVERLAGVRPGVDEGERLVVDEVAVHPPDGERCGDAQQVDARVTGAHKCSLSGG